MDVTHEDPAPPKIISVTLELTGDEAAALRQLFYHLPIYGAAEHEPDSAPLRAVKHALDRSHVTRTLTRWNLERV